jgi:hypothetical protein
LIEGFAQDLSCTQYSKVDYPPKLSAKETVYVYFIPNVLLLYLRVSYGGFLSPPQYAQLFGPRSGRIKENW